MILVNIIILILSAFILIRSKNYEKNFIDRLDSKKFKFKPFFSAGLYVFDYISKFKQHINLEKQSKSLKAIHVGEPINTVKRIYMCNKIIIFGLVIFLFNILSVLSYIDTNNSKALQKDNYILRPKTYEDTKNLKLGVYVTKEDRLVLEDEINLEVQGKKYDKEELNELILKAKKYIDSTILKENKSLKEITNDLNLISNIPGTELYVKWETEDYQLISREGKVNNEELNKGVNTWILAIIEYYDIQVEYKLEATVLPKMFTEKEITYRKLMEEVVKEDESSTTDEKIKLPNTIDEMEVLWKEKKESSSGTFLIIGIVAAIVIFLAYDKDLYEKVEKRNRQMLLDYPEIINKITLLLGAGMPLANAWHKIVQDYKQKEASKRYVYEEMIITSNELKLGKSEILAYESFGRRVKLLPYLRLASLLAQNIKKGSEDLLKILEIEAANSFEERKELAKRIGEKAGTKLLFPMMLMLLIVLVIVIVPAFSSFKL